MDDRDLSEPVVREGESELNNGGAEHRGVMLVDRDRLNEWIKEWNRGEDPFIEMSPDERAFFHQWMKDWNRGDDPFQEHPGEKAPQALDMPRQEEVKAQEALMRDVVSLMQPVTDASEMALLSPDEISRVQAFVPEQDHEKGIEIGLGDE